MKALSTKQLQKIQKLNKELEYWKQVKREIGSNYINEYYISKYEGEIESVKYPINHIENCTTESVVDEEGQRERMHKRIKQLKRKQKKQGYLSYWDSVLLTGMIEDYGDVKL